MFVSIVGFAQLWCKKREEKTNMCECCRCTIFLVLLFFFLIRQNECSKKSRRRRRTNERTNEWINEWIRTPSSSHFHGMNQRRRTLCLYQGQFVDFHNDEANSVIPKEKTTKHVLWDFFLSYLDTSFDYLSFSSKSRMPGKIPFSWY